jgi:hypothetical protein
MIAKLLLLFGSTRSSFNNNLTILKCPLNDATLIAQL